MEGGSVQIKNIRNHLLMSISIYHVIKFNKVNAEAQIETNIIGETYLNVDFWKFHFNSHHLWVRLTNGKRNIPMKSTAWVVDHLLLLRREKREKKFTKHKNPTSNFTEFIFYKIFISKLHVVLPTTTSQHVCDVYWQCQQLHNFILFVILTHLKCYKKWK